MSYFIVCLILAGIPYEEQLDSYLNGDSKDVLVGTNVKLDPTYRLSAEKTDNTGEKTDNSGDNKHTSDGQESVGDKQQCENGEEEKALENSQEKSNL